jgi:methionyl aminopeptidase
MEKSKRKTDVILKSVKEIWKMRECAFFLAEFLQQLKLQVRPGVTTNELNKYAESLLFERSLTPAFKGYEDFPASLCTSVNNIVCHGLPSNYKLKKGDIVGLDFGVYHNGFYSDSTITVPVGKVSQKTEKLLRVTEEALYRGIDKARIGNRISDISKAIEDCVGETEFSIVRALTGHGIGRGLHEGPKVYNYVNKDDDMELEYGLVFAIEPMVNIGTYEIQRLEDGFSIGTADGSLSAHFEHTVAILETGPWILSLI